MNLREQMDAVILKHDLFQHPFYQAWTAGKLGVADLKRYAQQYYHHVAAFPTYLSSLHSRLPDGELRRAILRNLAEEEIVGATHSELWLDFAEGMGAVRDEVRGSTPSGAIQELISAFRSMATERSAAPVMGAFYAYESQVARIATTKADTLKEKYGEDAKACAYFQLHATQDEHHAYVWAKWIEREARGMASEVLATVDETASHLWKSLTALAA